MGSRRDFFVPAKSRDLIRADLRLLRAIVGSADERRHLPAPEDINTAAIHCASIVYLDDVYVRMLSVISIRPYRTQKILLRNGFLPPRAKCAVVTPVVITAGA